jgi:hypothetical protein
MTAHSIFGPSSAHRWLSCPGSIMAEKDIPEQESEYALEGTLAHKLAEICLSNGKRPIEFVGQALLINKEWVVTPEMADCIEEYVDFIRTLGGNQEYEQMVDYGEYVPGGFGTADVIVTSDSILRTIDLKYGKGVKVDAEENPQGMLYALGALIERAAFQSFDTVAITIYQPRLDHISTWETTPDRIYEFGRYAGERAKLAMAKKPKRIAGESQCRFCKAAPNCPALQTKTELALLTEFDNLTITEPPPPKTLQDDQLSFILHNKTLIETWLKAVEDHVTNRLMTGEVFPGWKLVHGRSVRQWADPEVAEKVLRAYLSEAAYTKKILSPAQAEKALGKEDKKKIEELIVKPDGKPVLVPEDDARAPIQLITASDFD